MNGRLFCFPFTFLPVLKRLVLNATRSSLVASNFLLNCFFPRLRSQHSRNCDANGCEVRTNRSAFLLLDPVLENSPFGGNCFLSRCYSVSMFVDLGGLTRIVSAASSIELSSTINSSSNPRFKSRFYLHAIVTHFTVHHRTSSCIRSLFYEHFSTSSFMRS